MDIDSVYVNFSNNKNSDCSSWSKTQQDKKFDTSIETRKRSHMVSGSALAILNAVDRIVKDPKKLDQDQKRAVGEVRRTIVPFLKESSQFFSSVATVLSPIGGLYYIDQHNQKQLIMEIKIQNTDSRKRLPLKRLERQLSKKPIVEPTALQKIFMTIILLFSV